MNLHATPDRGATTTSRSIKPQSDPVTIDTVGEEMFLHNQYAHQAVEASMGKDFFIRRLLEIIDELNSRLVDCHKYGMPDIVIQAKREES